MFLHPHIVYAPHIPPLSVSFSLNPQLTCLLHFFTPLLYAYVPTSYPMALHNNVPRPAPRHAPRPAPRPIGDYIPLSTLGVGSTGKVKLARHVATKQLVALKLIRKTLLRAKPHLLQKIRREIAIMKLVASNCRHIHRQHSLPAAPRPRVGIMNLIDVYDTDTSIVLVLDYCQGGELFDHLIQNGHLPEPHVRDFFQQLVHALQFCHNRGVCHRDIKPENVLLTADGRLKLADFGMATLLTPGALMETSCGSPQYCAPEVLLAEVYEGCAADVWSLGVILFAMTTGGLPFDDDNFQRLISKIQSGAFYIPPDVPAPLAELIQSMLVVDPAQRITLDQIKRLDWFNATPCRTDVYKDDSASAQAMFAAFDDRPIHHPDSQILRYLADLGLGDFPTLRRRLASPETCLERDCYNQFAELGRGALQFREVDEIPTSPLTTSADSSPNSRTSLCTTPQSFEREFAEAHVKPAAKSVVDVPTRRAIGQSEGSCHSQKQSDCGDKLVDGQQSIPLDVRWFPGWEALLPSESDHDAVQTSIMPYNCSRQLSFPTLILR